MEKEQPKTVNIPFSLCNNICRHLSTLEIYLKGEHNHETDAIQEKEDWELYQETIKIKEELEDLTAETIKLAAFNARLEVFNEFMNSEPRTEMNCKWAIKNILGISDDNSKK